MIYQRFLLKLFSQNTRNGVSGGACRLTPPLAVRFLSLDANTSFFYLMRTQAGILVGSRDQSHKYGIPLPPTLFPSMLPGPENMEGRSPCRENNDSLPIQILRCDMPFGQFKEGKPKDFGRGTSYVATV